MISPKPTFRAAPASFATEQAPVEHTPRFDRFRITQQLLATRSATNPILFPIHTSTSSDFHASSAPTTLPYMSIGAIRQGHRIAAIAFNPKHFLSAARPHLHLLPFAPRARFPSSSITTATSKPSAAKKKPALTLEHFLLRQRVLGLYRSIVRSLHALPRGAAQREELRAYARGEFERHRAVSDAGKIRYLVSMGKTEFDGMRRYLGEMGGR